MGLVTLTCQHRGRRPSARRDRWPAGTVRPGRSGHLGPARLRADLPQPVSRKETRHHPAPAHHRTGLRRPIRQLTPERLITNAWPARPSAGTLGSTSAINSDKTGTLTLNQMTAVQMAIAGARFALGRCPPVRRWQQACLVEVLGVEADRADHVLAPGFVIPAEQVGVHPSRHESVTVQRRGRGACRAGEHEPAEDGAMPRARRFRRCMVFLSSPLRCVPQSGGLALGHASSLRASCDNLRGPPARGSGRLGLMAGPAAPPPGSAGR
jgi:hypothetical protein